MWLTSTDKSVQQVALLSVLSVVSLICIGHTGPISFNNWMYVCIIIANEWICVQFACRKLSSPAAGAVRFHIS